MKIPEEHKTKGGKMIFKYYENLSTQWALKRNIKDIASSLKNIYQNEPKIKEMNYVKGLIFEMQTNLKVLRQLRNLEKTL